MKLKNKHSSILFIDTETGGTNPEKHQLLSIGLVHWDKGDLTKEHQILIDDSPMSITKEALEINRIDVKEHFKQAKSNSSAFNDLTEYLDKIKKPNSKIIIAGHNVMFDVNFLKRFFKDNEANFSKYFSHRIIDTYSIMTFLNMSGILKGELYNSDKAFEEFEIKIKGRHTAIGDAIGTAMLYNKLLLLLSAKRKTTDNT